MRLLFVDNYDSFTYNIVHLLASLGVPPEVVLSDDPRVRGEIVREYDAVVVGPGPGNPSQTPQILEVITAAAASGTPVFGVCFGLQSIAQAFGASIVRAPAPMHGKTSAIIHSGTGMFAGLPTPFTATRYHSLCIDKATLPDELEVTARSSDGVIQAIAHRTLPITAVQFHPESILSEHGDRLVRNALRIDTAARA